MKINIKVVFYKCQQKDCLLSLAIITITKLCSSDTPSTKLILGIEKKCESQTSKHVAVIGMLGHQNS